VPALRHKRVLILILRMRTSYRSCIEAAGRQLSLCCLVGSLLKQSCIWHICWPLHSCFMFYLACNHASTPTSLSLQPRAVAAKYGLIDGVSAGGPHSTSKTVLNGASHSVRIGCICKAVSIWLLLAHRISSAEFRATNRATTAVSGQTV